MSKKSFGIQLLAVFLVLLLLVGCGSQAPEIESDTSSEADAPSEDVIESEEEKAEPAPEEAEEAMEPVKLAVQVLTTEIEYFEELRQAYIKSAEEKGYEIVTSDAQADPAVQVSFIEDQIAAGVDVIILSIVDAATAQPAIEDAIAQGVPVIVQGQEEEDFPWATANVGYNEEAMGIFAGELVATCLAEKFPDVETYNGVSCTWPDWPSTQRRDAAAKTAVEEAGEVNWVLEQKCGTREWGLEVVEAALVSEPDLHFVVGVNDASSIGAVAAYESAGLDPTEVCIAGPNNDREVRQYVADGRVYGTVDLNVEGLAASAVDLAGEIAAGDDVAKMTYVDMFPVTSENIGDFASEADTQPAPKEAEEAMEPVKLAVQVLTTEIEYFEELRQAYIKSAEEKGYEIVTSDAQADPAVQVSFIEDQIAAGVDVIILSIVDAATAQPAIEDAIAQGVPVIVQGQEEEDFPWATANVGYNEEAMGIFAGELVATCLAEKFPDVETYNGVSCTWPDWPSTQRRDAAAKTAVEEAGEVNWVLEQKCGTREWGLEVVEAALVSEPDLHFVVGVNDASSIGAVAAYESAGLDPTEVCIAAPNNDREVRQYVADGRVYGTVDLNVEGLAASAVDLAGEIAAGNDVAKMTYVDMFPVTIENIGDFIE